MTSCMRRLPLPEHIPTPGPPEVPTGRHMEILQAAMHLVAEKGYAGASLRLLARTVGMSQPSLYHYFPSKEALVEQVVLHCGAQFLVVPGLDRFPGRLEEVPRFMMDMMARIYENPGYPVFLRFVFAVSTIKPQYAAAARRLYVDSFKLATPVLMKPFVDRGDISAEDALYFMRLCINSVALSLIEDHVLYGQQEPDAFFEGYVRFLEDVLVAAAVRTSERARGG